MLFSLPVLWTVNNFLFLSVRCFTASSSAVSYPVCLKHIPFSKEFHFSSSRKLPHCRYSGVLWCVHHFRQCVCVCSSIVLRALLPVRLQMLSFAHLGWVGAVRCERDPQQQNSNENKALPCVATCLWVHSYLLRDWDTKFSIISDVPPFFSLC